VPAMIWTVAAVVLGLAVLAFVWQVRHQGSVGESVFGAPDVGAPTTAPTTSVYRATKPGTGPVVAEGDVGDQQELVDQLFAAMADGDLDEAEIQRLMPGATVTRDGDEVTIVSEVVTSLERIEGPDGQVYESIDDVPDPEVRERLRRLLDDE